MDDLIAARDLLTNAIADCEPGCFPGSKGWAKENAAIKALTAFDLANPTVRAAHLATTY
jgi:hypothetical protein